jgi:AP-1 complex subunit mu
MGYGPSGIYILDIKGKGIIHRAYRRDAPAATIVSERFTRMVLEAEEEGIRPVFVHNDVSYLWIKYNNLFIVGTSALNANAMMVFAFLYRLAEVLTEYFRALEEESIKDNFVVTYELLDEMVDNGYPQITEPKVLKEYIKSESNRLEEKKAAVPLPPLNAVSWRPEGIRHKKNEVFLDVVEKLSLLVASNGSVLRSEIIGALKMRCLLTGMPELKLGLNDKLQFEATGRQSKGKAIELEDTKFHQCVRLSRFESDRTISFIPPDGEFELMSYRLSTHVKPLIWVEAVIESQSSCRLEYMVKAKSQFKARSVANNVQIIVPVPGDADSPQFKTSIGSAKYDPGQDAFVWSIKQLPGQKEYTARAQFSLPSIVSQHREQYKKTPIRVKFEIPYFTVSGIQVRYLKIIEKSGYQALPWVRYITQNGEYQLRMT